MNDKLITINNDIFEILLSENQIQTRVEELGKEISRDYEGKNPILLGALNGAFIFVADLSRNIDINCEVDFLKVSSYRKGMQSSGKIELLTKVTTQIEGREILIIDDIIDSGLTLIYLKELINEYEPKSVKVATLLYKKEADIHKISPEYVGFEIPNKFVIGYGLDYGYYYRNLKSIYALKS